MAHTSRKFAGKLRAGVVSAMIFGMAAGAQYTFVAPSFAESGVVHLTASTNAKIVKIAQAKPKTVRTDASFSEIVIGDPDIATVTPLTDRSFYIVGNTPGTTGVALYDAESNLVAVLDIEVGPNTNQLNSALQAALPKSTVKATTTNGRVVLKGKANDAKAAAKARAIAEKYDEELIDAVKIKGSQQVKLEVRFIEAQRNRGKEIGVGNRISRTTSDTTSTAISNSDVGTDLAGNPALILGNLISGSVPFGQFLTSIVKDGTNIDIAIQALEERGLARRLAEPNLVALSGDTASFLAGGEFPIPVSNGDDGFEIEFKEFGVGLKFTPTVLDNGLINLKLAPEVSQIDFTNAVNFGNGGLIPAIVVRRAETTLEIRDGQSFVLGGLLQSNTNVNKRQVPWLGDIPVIGALFRSSAYQRDETDLVIVVTPRLVKPLVPGEEPATPLDATVAANDVDLFVNGDLEVSRAHLRKLADARNGALKSGHVIDLD
ncbi:MAG: type II and III secretion system protein family protein [Pseudomonadota bacterium]